jgi:hypothetical protein
MSQCSGTTADGKPCGVRCLVGQPWCFNHAPDDEVAAQRDEARREGGRARGIQLTRAAAVTDFEEPEWWPLKGTGEVRGAFAWTARGLARGTIDARTANAMAAALRGLLDAIKDNEADSRLRSLEAALGGRK